MSVKMPSRPMKGAIIPHNYFQEMWDHQKSLELHGDLQTTVVKRDRSGTVVRAPRQGGNNSTVRAHAYIFKITAANFDGTYDAVEQANTDGTFSNGLAASALSLGTATDDHGLLYELNGWQGVPVGTFVVVHRVANTTGGPIWYFDSGMDAGGRSFWAKITGETTGSYSWTELQGDATTATSRTGTTNAEEVSGRLGIPTNSIVRMWSNAADYAEYKFEYHGANNGTLDILDSGVGTSANSDEWERADQGVTRGEIHPYVARLTLDSSTGELAAYSRTQTHDANGHETNISSETKTLLGVSTPSDETYEFVDCATDLVTVARFAFADLPDDDYCWVHDGSNMVKAYNDGISAGAATSPVPCAMYMPTTPANCAAVTLSAFNDSFDDSGFDACQWDTLTTGSATLAETTKVVATFSNTSGGATLTLSVAPVGDFDAEFDFSSLVTFAAAAGAAYSQLQIKATIGSDTYSANAGDLETAFPSFVNGIGVFSLKEPGDVVNQYQSSIPSSGTLGVSRSGTTLTLTFDGNTIETYTVATTAATIKIVFGGKTNSGSDTSTVDITDFTITE